MVAKNGKYTHVEIEWRFDPMPSENEIPPIDEDKDGKISAEEAKLLVRDMMPELQKVGFLTWLNTGGKDFRPPSRRNSPRASTIRRPSCRPTGIARPATMPACRCRPTSGSTILRRRARRGRAISSTSCASRCREPSKFVSITTFDPDDFIRIEVDKASVPAGCKLAKHPTYKAEFVRGHPVFADWVTCRLP